MAFQQMHIFVVNNGREHRIRTDPSITIYQLKCQIQVDIGVPVHQQSLMFNGEFLNNEFTVGDYPITHGVKILLQQGIPVFIDTPSGQFWLVVEDSTTVKDLKQKIERKTYIPAQRMKLLAGHRVMDDCYAMYTYDIVEGSQITVSVPPPLFSRF